MVIIMNLRAQLTVNTGCMGSHGAQKAYRELDGLHLIQRVRAMGVMLCADGVVMIYSE